VDAWTRASTDFTLFRDITLRLICFQVCVGRYPNTNFHFLSVPKKYIVYRSRNKSFNLNATKPIQCALPNHSLLVILRLSTIQRL